MAYNIVSVGRYLTVEYIAKKYSDIQFSQFLYLYLKHISPTLCLCPFVTGADLHIVTNRLQYFKYEPVSFQCKALDGSTQFRGIRNTDGFLSACSIKTAPKGLSCTIDTAYPGDSGVYWCETVGGERSNSVSITITGTFEFL